MLVSGDHSAPSVPLQASHSPLRLREAGPLPPEAAQPYATLRGHLESRGQPIGPNDALIAAHALALGATLVSGDDEFAHVPGLKVENWLKPLDVPGV